MRIFKAKMACIRNVTPLISLEMETILKKTLKSFFRSILDLIDITQILYLLIGFQLIVCIENLVYKHTSRLGIKEWFSTNHYPTFCCSSVYQYILWKEEWLIIAFNYKYKELTNFQLSACFDWCFYCVFNIKKHTTDMYFYIRIQS